jgi:hypothetical protein
MNDVITRKAEKEQKERERERERESFKTGIQNAHEKCI